MTLLSITDLVFAWKNQEPLLKITDFKLLECEKIFLHGASGSGKTTLLSLISGTALPLSGSVHLLGHDLTKLSAAKRDNLRTQYTGYIFQQFNLLGFLSVIDNVTLPCYFSDLRKQNAIKNAGSVVKAAEQLLERLAIAPTLWQCKAGELSIGQQQRIAAARALIGSPKLIIADEPTSALDFDNQKAFLQLLFEQCLSCNAGLLFVSHDQSLAQFFDKSVAISDINEVNI